MTRLLKILAVLALCLGAAAAGLWVKLAQWAGETESLTAEKIVDFPAGTTLPRLAMSLEDEGVISDSIMFQAWVRTTGSYRRFQAGTYRFEGKVAPKDVVEKILKGETYAPIVLSITIPEGFMLKQVIERLAANKVGHIVEINRIASDRGFLDAQNVPAKTLEGYLYPATYNYTQFPTAAVAFTDMVKQFWAHLPEGYERAVKAKGLTLDQAVTFASLIERETQTDDERPFVSEVIWRRLKDNVPLGIDATIPYGIDDYDGDLKWADLKNAKNPYNTRIHKGLPPTAIGAPSAKSLAAVLTPSNRGFYYYVLIPGTVQHHFSKTLKEHTQHVKNLVNATKRDTKKDKKEH